MAAQETSAPGASSPGPAEALPRQTAGPPCRRCGGRTWSVEALPKGRLRWLLETAFAAPDVWIFQSESGGWPARVYDRWTCLACGRSVRLSGRRDAAP